ncbi:hypothetical protein EJB05_16167, partial [Eragrostis curvula]
MPIYSIRGVDVDFPFDAYDCQITYMDRVLESLQQVTIPPPTPKPPALNLRGPKISFDSDCFALAFPHWIDGQGKNALLESPTGTGKTLCLLCASLAWRRSFGEFLRGGRGGGGRSSGASQLPPYGSQPSSSQQPEESPSQHRSATQQQSPYPVIIYASRTHSQLRQVIKELKATSYSLTDYALCVVWEYLQPKMAVLGSREQMCIHEEVRTLRGRAQNNACHYLARNASAVIKTLSLVNYMRNNTDLGSEPFDIEDLVTIARSKGPCPYYISRELSKSESICADAASFDLHPNNLSSCVAEAHECIKLCAAKRSIESAADKHLTLKIMQSSKEILLKLDQGSRQRPRWSRLESIRDILDIIFRGGGQSHAKYYRFHVNESQQTSGDALKVLGKSSRTFSWWCFNPGLAMEEFLKLGVRSIILTSGTLSPLDSLAMELNLEFPVRLENPHVISPDQIWVGVVPVGPSGHALNSSYRTRETIQYKQELGSAIVNFARIVPDGLLVFFPSYSMMDKCVEFWKNRNHANSSDENTIWQRICKHKQPVIEPRQSSNFPSAIEDYAAKLRDSSTSGAIFFAVCRGKNYNFRNALLKAVVSEGLDFADRAGRAVIVTGMPFATPTDPKVRLKREYLDKQATPSNKNTKEKNGMCNKQQGLSIKLLDVLSDIAMIMELLFIVTKDRVASLSNKCMAQETLSDLAGSARNERPQTTLVTARNNFMKLAQITPANRSTHSVSTSQLFSSKEELSRDDLVIDLTADTSTHGHMKEHTFKALGLKKAKIMDRSKDALCDDGSTKLAQNVESRAVARYLGERSTSQSKKNTAEQTCEKNDTVPGKSEGQESYSGSAFLKLAQEKLSGVEYREFVEFMKALKLKTMHIKESLEAIAKLFSSPGRRLLLEGFRVFVPKNHLPLYEQLVQRYTVPNTS